MLYVLFMCCPSSYTETGFCFSFPFLMHMNFKTDFNCIHRDPHEGLTSISLPNTASTWGEKAHLPRGIVSMTSSGRHVRISLSQSNFTFLNNCIYFFILQHEERCSSPRPAALTDISPIPPPEEEEEMEEDGKLAHCNHGRMHVLEAHHCEDC